MMALILLSLALGACVHTPERRDPVLAHPANYVGQHVRVCGLRVDGANIVESYPFDQRRPGGISIRHPGPLGVRQGRICVTGTIPARLCHGRLHGCGFRLRYHHRARASLNPRDPRE
jgi:hypothetical protein